MPSASAIDVKARWPNIRRVWLLYLMFGAAYSALFLVGVYTEDNIILRLVWPANAFMLGMIVRFPLLSRPPGWIACFVGFAVSIWIIGYGIEIGIALAAYNFGIVAISYLVITRFERSDQRLERPTSIFCLLAAVVPACIFAGVGSSVLVGSLYFNQAEVSAFRYWFSVELLNQLALLPMILTLPQQGEWLRQLPHSIRDLAPVLVLILSALVGIVFGGMAALAFPVPALLWCAISYRVFLTALLTFSFCTWAIFTTTLGYVQVSDATVPTVLSISMAGSLISLGPLIISTTTATRNEFLEQMKSLAAEREIVSRELEHRIKNLFALINGLISISARDYPGAKPLADTLRQRLVALQLAHGLIYAEKSGGAPSVRTSLRELIGVLLRPYQDGAERKIVFDDDVFIDRGMVTSLALVFHELATNSTKHGALSDPKGVLEIQVTRGIDALHIRWMEKAARAEGPPNIPDSGFGSKLLDLTIKSQLQGNYSRDWKSGCMVIDITLPGKLFHGLPYR